MFTQLFPNLLSISLGQVSSDNGLPHVSLKVSIKGTKHEGLFGFKKFLFLRFPTWSIGGVQDLIALKGLGNYEKDSLEAIKIPFIFEGRVCSYFSFNTLFDGEYPVGLDEDMGPEGTCSGP